MGYVLGQSGWVLGTAISLGTVVLLRDCGSRLVGCCEELQARGFSAPSYTTIGREAFGEPGRWVVLVAVVLELWLGIVWLSIVAWNNCALMLAGYPLHWLLYFLLLATTATVWLRTLKQVGWLSLLAAVALLICVASVAAQLRLLPRLAPRDFSVARWDGVGASTSIIAAAFAGHVALPTIYGAMQVRSSADPVLPPSLQDPAPNPQDSSRGPGLACSSSPSPPPPPPPPLPAHATARHAHAPCPPPSSLLRSTRASCGAR